jgi:rRNA maturation protein Nop10
VTLITIDPDTCPVCGSELGLEQVDQLPLVRHGGYGAARRTITRHCPDCGYSLNHVVTETRP